MRFLILALLFCASTAFAQTPLTPVFNDTFETNYRAGECGKNVMKLVKIATEQGLDLSKARVIQITNKANWNFAMVGGFEARNYRFPPPTREKIAYTDLRNWYHHVFLEFDGYIYDYDFGVAPQIVPVAEYVERMFLPEKKWSLGSVITPREDRLKGYQVEIHPALSTLDSKKIEGQIMTLGEFLSHF